MSFGKSPDSAAVVLGRILASQRVREARQQRPHSAFHDHWASVEVLKGALGHISGSLSARDAAGAPQNPFSRHDPGDAAIPGPAARFAPQSAERCSHTRRAGQV